MTDPTIGFVDDTLGICSVCSRGDSGPMSHSSDKFICNFLCMVGGNTKENLL